MTVSIGFDTPEVRLLDTESAVPGTSLHLLRKIYLAHKQCFGDVSSMVDYLNADPKYLSTIEDDTLPKNLRRLNDTDYMYKFILEKLAYGHESCVEHSNLTFLITKASRVMINQLERHRIASYSQMSDRYVSRAGDTSPMYMFTLPDTIANNPEALTIYRNRLELAMTGYTELMELGIPQEDARCLYPMGIHSSVIMSMNLRSLYGFFNLRCCYRAQAEIRVVAAQMLECCKQVLPGLFQTAGPKCLKLNRCPEKEPCKFVPFKQKHSD